MNQMKLMRPVASEEVFERLEEKFGAVIPADVKAWLLANSRGIPDEKEAVLGGKTRLVAGFLSASLRDRMNLYALTGMLPQPEDAVFVPVAGDGFGGYYGLRCGKESAPDVAYYNAEEGSFEKAAEDFGSFLAALGFEL